MRVVAGIAAVVAMLVILTGCGGSPPRGNIADWLTACPDTTAPWVRTANALVAAGQPARAEEIYRAVLARTPTDECAARGLAALAVAPAEPSLARNVGSSWAATAEKFLTPLVEPLLAALGVFVFLLVVARLTTPLFVGPNDVSWKAQWHRRLGYNIGLALVVAAAVSPVVAALLDQRGTDGSGTYPTSGVLVSMVGVGLVGVSTSFLRRADKRSPGHRRSATPQQTARPQQIAGRRFIWTAFFVSWAVIIFGFVMLALAPSAFILALLAGLLAAIAGIGLVATTRGQVLRLVVEVRGTSGTSDANAAQYLVGRLTAMGSARPRGLEVPRDTDVTKLPAEALTTLPDASLAKLAFSLVLAMRPGIPWRADVSLHDATTVTIALSRNGRMIDVVETFSRTRLDLPAAADDNDATGNGSRHLLTAAAAYVLIELSQRHTELQCGLCGTTRSRSLAMHAIATDPSAGLTTDQVQHLHTAALADDPDSGLALVADLNRLGWEATPQKQAEVAKAVDVVFDSVAKLPDAETLRMRLAYTRAAARLNALLIYQAGGSDEVACDAMRTAVIKLVETLHANEDPEHTELRDELRRAAAYLAMTGKSLNKQPNDEFSKAVQTACKWLHNKEKAGIRSPHGAAGAYDRACWRATERNPLRWKEMVLADLSIAVADERLKTWARHDPSLASLRDSKDGDWAARFNRLVGINPATAFLELAPIAPHRTALEAIGVRDAADFVAISPHVLAEKLGVPVLIVQRWQALIPCSAGGISSDGG